MTVGPLFLFSSSWKFLGLVIGPVLLAFIIYEDLFPMARTWLVIDDQTIAGHVRQGTFKVYWKNILIAQMLEGQQQTFHLFLVIPETALSIPLKYVDISRIWELVQAHVSPSALEEKTYTDWWDLENDELYQKWIARNEELIQSITTPLHARPKGWIIALGWVNVILFTAGAVGSLLSGAGWVVGVLFLVFALPGVINVLPDVVEMDASAITHIIPPFGRYRIQWDEIRWIEHAPRWNWLILHGENKHLAMVGPTWWSGKDAETMCALLDAQIQRRDIRTQVNERAMFKIFSKNTRVR
jgi:hypothetical protein